MERGERPRRCADVDRAADRSGRECPRRGRVGEGIGWCVERWRRGRRRAAGNARERGCNQEPSGTRHFVPPDAVAEGLSGKLT